jgi:phosphatidyl-myo-inositol dimannoside synthase
MPSRRRSARRSRVRILILATDIFTRGGIARYTAALAEALSRVPARVDVLPLLGARDSRFSGDSATEAGYTTLTPTASQLGPAAKARHALRAMKQAGVRYDLVICSHLSQATIAALLRLRYGTPYLVVAHGSEAWQRLPAAKRLAVRRAGAVLAVSAYTARTMAVANRIPAARVKVIYNAIPDSLVTALAQGPAVRVDGASPTLLSVGSLRAEHAYKGFDTVIHALPRILAVVPAARYVVAGGGDDRGRLERLASTLGVAGHVTFTGEVSDAELVSLYRACDLFVQPSRTSQVPGQCEGEGFGRVYVEAALAGKPVVGSREGGAAEALLDGRTGWLVDPRSASDVADAVIRALKSPRLAALFGAEGRRWARSRFTVAAMRRSLAPILSAGRRASVAERLPVIGFQSPRLSLEYPSRAGRTTKGEPGAARQWTAVGRI